MKNWRLTLFILLFFIAALVIIGRLFYLQVVNHKFYQAQALGQQTGFTEVFGTRGEVFFKNSKDNHGAFGIADAKSLAINKDKWLLSAVPGNVKDKSAVALLLSNAIGDSKESILSRLEKPGSYVVIKKDLVESQIQAIKNTNIEGVTLEAVPSRYYPQKNTASQVVGFYGGALEGQYGIEGYYEDLLKGKRGIEERKKGLSIINSDQAANLNGSDLYLTLDYNIQFQAESLLKEEKIKNNIASGQIIVIKPDSGRILAMANFPSFDPNAYSKERDLAIFQNSAIQKLFEPGSVFKPFTMAMVLQENKATPATTFIDTGSVTIGPDTIRNFNHEVYGKRDLAGILEKSINTGAVFLSSLISHQTFSDYLDVFGFNDKTGIDLQGEVASQNELLKHGSDFGFATASFGQGVEMTPIQLVRAFCVFANGGKMPKPYIVEKIVHGQEEEITQPRILTSVISPETVSEVTTMLINVVEKGYGDGARIPGYYLAGKTGTAQVPFENKKGYYPDKTIQSFIGYGPALKPQFLILVKLDDPKVPKSALSAVPVFKKLAQYIINYWQIPPDYDVTR